MTSEPTCVMRRWHPRLLLSAAFLGTVCSVTLPVMAVAQEQAAPRSYAIPAGPLAQALSALGRQSGLQVSFAPSVAAGLTSPGFSGGGSAEAALASVLAGTGLEYVFSAAGAVTILRPGAEGQGASGFFLGTIRLFGDRTASTLEESRSSVAVVRGEPTDAPAVQTRTGTFRRMANVQAGDWITSGFVIRGISSEGLVPGGADAPLASFYIDGVPQTTEATRLGQRGMFDIEQVEVYRGPQSTLSGRAALAGALYMRSVEPEFTRSGAAQLTVGSDRRRQIGLAFGDRITDRLAYRISGEYSERRSDLNFPSYERFARYEDFVTESYQSLRARLLWVPGDDAQTRLLFSLSRVHDSPTPRDIAGGLWSSTAPDYGARRGDVWGDIVPDYYRSLGVTELPVFQELREGQVDSFGMELTHDFSAALRLTAVTGLTRSLTDRNSINDGTADEIFTTRGRFTQRTYSQELRLNYDDGPLRWVGGLYLARLDNDAWRNTRLLTSDRSANSAAITNIALFGESSWEFSPGWRAVAGGRLDWIRQRQSAWYEVNGAVTTDQDSSFRDRVFLPRAGIEHTTASGQTIALNYQQGYRPGGAAVRASDGVVYTYEPETAHNLELSWRGRLPGDRMWLSAHVFAQRWRDQQVEVVTDPTHPRPRTTGQIMNAGRSTSAGGELELAWSASDRLEVYGSAGLLRTRFDDFRMETWGLDYTGTEFPGAPRRTLALGFRWGEDRGWFAAGSLKYVSSQLSRLEQGVAAPVRLAGYTTVDAEIGYTLRSGARLTGYVNNLFDRQYFVYEYGPGALATLGEAREIGLRMDYRF